MTLLQIAEPNNRRLALGIDLGTTHSLVAMQGQGGDKVSLVYDHGTRLIPSVVAYSNDGTVCVGNDAIAKTGQNDWTVYSSIKRYMGISTAQMDNCPYAFDDSDSLPRFVVWKDRLTAQEISAAILRHLDGLATDQFGSAGTVVITVPAYFDDAQRKATRDAAELAGLPLKRLLNEPTAAALAYGLEHRNDGYIAVFDLGGGTFDISILQRADKLLKVLVSSGDTRLGGDDFDQQLLQLAVAKLNNPTLAIPTDPATYQQLRQRARAAKERLSTTTQTTIDLSLLDPTAPQVTVTREAFIEETSALHERCIHLTLEAIKDAGIANSDIDSLVLVGGSTRMPQISEALRRVMPEVEIYNQLDPDTTVAIGAAQLAATLAGEASDTTLVDVIPLSLGIETMHGLMETIIPRNTPIPAVREQQFTTSKDGQQQFLLHVLQGERDLAEDCRSLARFTLQGIPPMPAGAARLHISLSVDASGLLQVTARERTSGVSQQIQVQSTAGLDAEEIAQLLEASHQHAHQDTHERSRREALVESTRLLEATTSALHKDGDMLQPDERATITASVKRVEQLQQSTDVDAIRHANQALIEATTTFARRRMERTLQQELTNKRIE